MRCEQCAQQNLLQCGMGYRALEILGHICICSQQTASISNYSKCMLSLAAHTLRTHRGTGTH